MDGLFIYICHIYMSHQGATEINVFLPVFFGKGNLSLLLLLFAKVDQSAMESVDHLVEY